MNQVLVHFCAHIDYIGPEEPPEDGAVSEMTLPSRDKIRNSNPRCLRKSTLPLGHGGSQQYFYEFYEWMGKKHFCFFKNRRARETNPEL